QVAPHPANHAGTPSHRGRRPGTGVLRRPGAGGLVEPPRALVTGAASGIGAAFARDLRRRGWPLVLVARRLDRLKDLSRELGGEGVALPLAFDLAQNGAPERLHPDVRQRGLDIELLVNNAGMGHTGRFHEEPPEKILEMIDLNTRGLVDL